jgi:hypothetical protein
MEEWMSIVKSPIVVARLMGVMPGEQENGRFDLNSKFFEGS